MAKKRDRAQGRAEAEITGDSKPEMSFFGKNKISAEVLMSTGLWMTSWRLPTPRNRLETESILEALDQAASIVPIVVAFQWFALFYRVISHSMVLSCRKQKLQRRERWPSLGSSLLHNFHCHGNHQT